MSGTPLQFGLLGPLSVTRDGEPTAIRRQKSRALLAVLLLEPNRVVSRDSLIDALWGEAPPDTARNTLQAHVSHLRKLLPDGALETAPSGYRLVVAPETVDVFHFVGLAQEGRSRLAAGDLAGSAATLRAALDLWRGAPLADFVGEPFAQPEIARLDELRLAALEDRIDADLGLGRHDQLVPELELVVVEHPLRERPRAQLMLALYRAGRQADALAVYQQARKALVDDLGIEPGEALRKLERAILAHDQSVGIPLPGKVSPRRVPTPPYPLLGRERELTALADLVCRD